MSDLLHTWSGPDCVCLGWALIHFLWQGLLIAIVLELALVMAGRKNASLRYVLCGLALAVMPVCLIATYGSLGHASLKPSVPLNLGTTATASSQLATPDLTLIPVVRTITAFGTREIPSFDLNRFVPWIVAGWLIGVMILSGRKAGGFIVLWRLRRRGVSDPSDALSELFRDACGKIGVDPRCVCLKISTLVQVPMTMGWVRPIILFPAALLSGLSTGEIELLLAHELAHIRRLDYLVNLLQTVVETLFFYHPVTWWISRRMRQERENACDDLVAAEADQVLDYAKVLLHLETMRPAGAALASAANGGSLRQRIQQLVGEPAPMSGMGLPVLLALVAILGVITTVSMAAAQTSSPGKSADIPVAKPVPSTPEAVFAQPIAVKEQKPLPNSSSITRLYYQGENLVLQQTLNMSPGSIGQLVFYKGANLVDDRVGTVPPHIFSSREILPNDFKVRVQSIAADAISPAKLRILDEKDQIIMEFFIDQTGLMRPVTKAEHDADLARRKAAVDAAPPASNSAAPINGATQGSLLITKASYEAKDGTAAKDVTDIVTKMLKDNRLAVSVESDVFGGDPAWLHVKQLRVEYTMNGEKREVIADEGTILSIPVQANATTRQQGTGAQLAALPVGGFGQVFSQMGKMLETQAKAMADGATNLSTPVQTNAPNVAPAAQSHDDKDSDPFALPAEGSFGQLGRVMEIHATFSRELKPGVPAVHYYSQYRGLGTGMEGGVTWGGEIAVYGIPAPFVDGSTWKGIVYPAGHMTFGSDRLSVYATTKEQAVALMESESEKDRKSFPP